jgi:hypothetical protein
MGFYDYRCMISGVSLKGADAALVLLEEYRRAHRPIALAITGNYNRLGSIDGIDEDANTELVFGYFDERLKAGDLVVFEPELKHGGWSGIEAMLAIVERNVTESPNTFLLAGRSVFFALICRAVWKAVVAAHPPKDEAASELFARLFEGVEVAERIYSGNLTRVRKGLRELAAVNDFLAERGIRWKPPRDAGQHYDDDMRRYLGNARRKFHDCPEVLKGLREYEGEVRELLRREE